MAQAILAILLAKATAATFAERRSINFTAGVTELLGSPNHDERAFQKQWPAGMHVKHAKGHRSLGN